MERKTKAMVRIAEDGNQNREVGLIVLIFLFFYFILFFFGGSEIREGLMREK